MTQYLDCSCICLTTKRACCGASPDAEMLLLAWQSADDQGQQGINRSLQLAHAILVRALLSASLQSSAEGYARLLSAHP